MFKYFVNKEMVLLAGSQLCFGLLGALLIQVWVAHRTPPVIATVNMTGLEDSFIRETAKQALTTAEKQQKVTAFAKSLNEAIAQLAKQKHLVIVLSEAVIAGSPDLTEEIANDIKKRISA